MNLPLVTVVTVVLLVLEGKGKFSGAEDVNLQPCQEKSKKYRYDEFVHRHILTKSFDRRDKKEWSRYLLEKDLCGRTPVQSFIEADKDQVSQVCRTSGKRVVNGGNLCISISPMKVFDVISKKGIKNCSVTNVTGSNRKVVLACNKVDNTCRPVHYEKWKNQKAENLKCS